MKRNWKWITYISFLSILTSFILIKVMSTQSQPAKEVVMANQRKVELDFKSYSTSATVAAIGDILIHDWVYEDAQKKNGYNFAPMFEKVKPLLSKPDFLIANQESIPGGAELGISSYPCFNSPFEIVDALKEAGVDFVTNANNHSLDKGEKGILSSTDYYNEKGMPYVGAFASPEDQKTYRIQKVNGIKLGLLAYTYGTNGISVPDGKDYLVNLINDQKMINDIKQIKSKVDIVIVNVHWGNEYQRSPSEHQIELAHVLAENGADLIIGHHPHVLQPIEWIRGKDNKKTLVIYSLGNFLSGQIRDYKDIGGMVNINLEKKSVNNKIETIITNVSFSPTYVSSQHFRNYRVNPMEVVPTLRYTTEKVSSEDIIRFMLGKLD